MSIKVKVDNREKKEVQNDSTILDGFNDKPGTGR